MTLPLASSLCLLSQPTPATPAVGQRAAQAPECAGLVTPSYKSPPPDSLLSLQMGSCLAPVDLSPHLAGLPCFPTHLQYLTAYCCLPSSPEARPGCLPSEPTILHSVPKWTLGCAARAVATAPSGVVTQGAQSRAAPGEVLCVHERQQSHNEEPEGNKAFSTSSCLALGARRLREPGGKPSLASTSALNTALAGRCRVGSGTAGWQSAGPAAGSTQGEGCT